MYRDSWSKCPTGGHVGSFLSFAFTNNAMMNIPAYCPLSVYPADKVVCIQFCLQDKLIKVMCIWYLDRNCKSSSQYVWKCPLPWILYDTIVVFSALINEKCSHILVCIQLWVREKAMAPHSSVLGWRIPWTEKPGRLQSMGLHRVGHDWSDAAAAAAAWVNLKIMSCV